MDPLQAAGLGENGACYVLDMGEPLKIVDLARDVIRLSGLTPDVDIPITFTGIRPGEKLFEEILTAEEGTVATKHAKIFFAPQHPAPPEERVRLLDQLLAAARARDGSHIRRMLVELIPTYKTDSPVAAAPRPDRRSSELETMRAAIDAQFEEGESPPTPERGSATLPSRR